MKLDIDLGKKLTQAKVNVQLIILKLLLRSMLVTIIIIAGLRSNPPASITPNGAIFCLLIIAAIILWILFPLFHLKDYIIFYENGIEFNNQKWTFEELGEINFLDVKTNTSFFTNKYLETDLKDLNITYIKDAKKYFNKAYLKTN